MPSTISALIATAETGDSGAAQALFAALYQELHRLARGQLSRSSGEVTISTTSLLHEAYLDIAAREGLQFPDLARFMAYAARAMRGIIIDFVRERRAQKRGGQFELTSLEAEVADRAADPRELLGIAAALEQLETVDPQLVQIVDLKFFCGFSFAEIAALTGQAERTIRRHWEKARIFLRRAMAPE